jgi:hypothetical protein
LADRPCRKNLDFDSSRSTRKNMIERLFPAIEAGELPPELVQQLHLPRYDKLLATLLGRLARSEQFKGHGLGELLLMGALRRAPEHSRDIASVAVVVDAIDENPRAFYGRYGFIDIPNRTNRLFMPMKTAAQLLIRPV